MSGFVRTIQKRIFKTKFGLTRQTVEVRDDGTLHRFAKGQGPIVNNLGDRVGQHYPRLLTPSASE